MINTNSNKQNHCLVKDISNINYKTYNSNYNWDHILYLDTKNIIENNIISLKKYLHSDKVPSRAKRIVKKGDIIISTVRPNQKHYGLLKNIPKNLIVSTGFTVISPQKNIIDTNYLYYYLTQTHITNYLQNIAEQSTTSYPSIRTKDIENIELKILPLEIQRKTVKILKLIDKKIKVNKNINKNLYLNT